MSFPKDSSDEEDMDEQAFPTVFFWLFSKVWNQNRELPKQLEQKADHPKSK